MSLEDLEREIHRFSGQVYAKQDTATGNDPRRFETKPLKCRDVVVKVSTYDQVFGDSSGQTFTVVAGGNWGCTLIDVSSLYFKNATAGQNGVVNILGVRD